jgi:uncharacterized protein
MSDTLSKPCTVFEGAKRLASGPLSDMALVFKKALDKGGENVFLFDDTTGRTFDIDIRGTNAEVLARLQRSSPRAAEERGPGRPKLGVVAREVTLLPKQWEWLAAQPGGASVTLRKLVDEARRGPKAKARAARDAAYHFMQAIAGDRPGFEEATRALFADDRGRLAGLIAAWPKDIRDHATRLAFAESGLNAKPDKGGRH